MSDISIIVPVYNAEQWLDECLQSVLDQRFTSCDLKPSLQLSAFNDSSSDKSSLLLKQWKGRLERTGFKVVIGEHEGGSPRGVGFAKNEAVRQSEGKYLCFLDADDVMFPDRISSQFEAAISLCENYLIGTQFIREPENSTKRFTRWANSLTRDQLYTQAYTSHGPTVIMPTWLCHRSVWENVGGFSEAGKGSPEDLLFFLKHLELGGKLHRVDSCLLNYRYHPQQTTFSISEETIWRIRVEALQKQVLDKLTSFTIWNAGKQGRRLYRSLNERNRLKVQAFCDVCEKKMSKGVYTFENSENAVKPQVPIIHYKDARPPLIICVKLDLTGGAFEENLASLNLKEGSDFIHFN